MDVLERNMYQTVAFIIKNTLCVFISSIGYNILALKQLKQRSAALNINP